MLKKTLFALSLAVLATSVARPSHAEPNFLEEYGDIFGARPLLTSPEDTRPKSVLHSQAGVEDATTRFTVSPFFRTFDVGPGDVTFWGVGLNYARVTDPRHPFQLQANIFNTNVDLGSDDDFFSWEVIGKYVLHQPASVNQPVVSVVGRYRDVNGLYERFDALLAIDQRVTPNLYFTGNIGWGHLDADRFRFEGNDLVGGFGATWTPGAFPRFSLSGNYVFDNDIDGEDFWSVSGAYAVNNDVAVRVGGGKHSTVFANLFWKTDRR